MSQAELHKKTQKEKRQAVSPNWAVWPHLRLTTEPGPGEVCYVSLTVTPRAPRVSLTDRAPYGFSNLNEIGLVGPGTPRGHPM
jgi:hypothetical protein